MGTELEHKLEKTEEISRRALGYAEEVEKKRKETTPHEYLFNDLWWVRYHLKEIVVSARRVIK